MNLGCPLDGSGESTGYGKFNHLFVYVSACGAGQERLEEQGGLEPGVSREPIGDARGKSDHRETVVTLLELGSVPGLLVEVHADVRECERRENLLNRPGKIRPMGDTDSG